MVQNSSKRWTSGEDHRLRELISSKVDAFDIASELGRTVSAVKVRAQFLGLSLRRSTSQRVRRTWTEEEEEELRALILSGKSIEAVAKKLNRTPRAIRTRAGKLKLLLKSVY